MITGTGLGVLTDTMEVDFRLDYGEIPNFPHSTIEGHKGTMVFGKLAGESVLAMEGRFHIYEGYTAAEITFPVRVMAELGIKYLAGEAAENRPFLFRRKQHSVSIDGNLPLLLPLKIHFCSLTEHPEPFLFGQA